MTRCAIENMWSHLAKIVKVYLQEAVLGNKIYILINIMMIFNNIQRDTLLL